MIIAKNNAMKQLMLVIVNIFFLLSGIAQSLEKKQASFQFKDTVYNFVFDSVNNDLGLVEPVNINNRMIKHFIYTGDTPVIISNTKTSDPHFICDYPKEPIIKGKVYDFTVCFYFENGKGVFNKMMSLELSDGRSIYFRFKGRYKEK